jgi:hypothetical protein
MRRRTTTRRMRRRRTTTRRTRKRTSTRRRMVRCLSLLFLSSSCFDHVPSLPADKKDYNYKKPEYKKPEYKKIDDEKDFDFNDKKGLDYDDDKKDFGKGMFRLLFSPFSLLLADFARSPADFEYDDDNFSDFKNSFDKGDDGRFGQFGGYSEKFLDY